MRRNRWTTCVGMSGRLESEWVDGMRRNPKHGDLVGAIRLYDFRPVLEFLVQLRYVAEIDALVLHGRGLLGREGHFAARIDPQELTCKYILAYHASYGHLSCRR